MPCLVAFLALLAPRVAIVLLVLFSDYIGSAYETVVWPVLGFVFMPLTTLAYAWSMNTYGAVQGVGLAAVIVAAVVDLGLTEGSRRSRRKAAKRS